MNTWPKQCGCKRFYSWEQWGRLLFVGLMGDDIETIEMRNCDCGSTLAIVVTKPAMQVAA